MFFVLFLLLGQGALSRNNTYHITTANDLIQLSKNVSSGMGFEGTTVFLDADIDFSGGLSEQFEPIGINSNSLRGTFDGQGYTVNNFAMNSSLKHVGLFGYSSGAMIKNVVLGSSCTVVSSYSGTDLVV